MRRRSTVDLAAISSNLRPTNPLESIRANATRDPLGEIVEEVVDLISFIRDVRRFMQLRLWKDMESTVQDAEKCLSHIEASRVSGTLRHPHPS